MKTTRIAALAFFLAVFASTAVLGEAPSAPKRTELAKNIFFERDGERRRVVVLANVCLREGQLEGLLTRKGTKEHEYILSADVDARKIHTALLAAGAKAGSPVRFAPRYEPAHGTALRVSLRYAKGGSTIEVPAREWVQIVKDKKDLDQDWVFAGSQLVENEEDKTKPPYYLANQGDLICVCNMESALLDLPVRSTKTLDDRIFAAHTERIPPTGTAVEIVLEPRLDAPASKKDK